MYCVQRGKTGQYCSYYQSPCVHILQYGAAQPPLRQPNYEVRYSGPPYRQRNRQVLGISLHGVNTKFYRKLLPQSCRPYTTCTLRRETITKKIRDQASSSDTPAPAYRTYTTSHPACELCNRRTANTRNESTARQ